MHSFDLYPQAWILYIILGITLLFVVDLKLRNWRFAFRAGLLSFMAVGAFTPQTVTDTTLYAPLFLTSLLNAEVEGVTAIYQGLFTLVITWGIVLALTLAIKHFIDAKQKKQTATPTKVEPK